MKNLARVDECDKFIKIELEKSKLKIIKSASRGEVPYTLTGKCGDWVFTRAWYYWVATTTGRGIPLKEALIMRNKQYPDEMYDDYGNIRNYGKKIRAGGHCGSLSPDEYGATDGYVTSYHIDSQEGLNELVRVIKRIK